jgi:hypothetical protein
VSLLTTVTCAVSYAIGGDNDNGGLAGFSAHATGARQGVLRAASDHDFVLGKRLYQLVLYLVDDGTAPYGLASAVVPVAVNATVIHVPVPPLFMTHPYGNVTVDGTSPCVVYLFVVTLQNVLVWEGLSHCVCFLRCCLDSMNRAVGSRHCCCCSTSARRS